MKKPFEIEFIYKGEAIDTKSYDVLPYIPEVGEIIFLECENPAMNMESLYYKVLNKRTLFFNAPNLKQKVMIKLETQTSTEW